MHSDFRSGGSTVLWRGDGKEVFSATFMTLNVLPYGVTSDGQRFLVLEPKDPALHPLFTVAVNWQDALPN